MEQEEQYLYLNPLTDFGFKKIFGKETVMMAFLNDIIKPKFPIVSLTFINGEDKGDNEDMRGVVYDLRCRLGDGSEIIVEMQKAGQPHFSDRIVYYLSRSISPQGYRGKRPISEDEKKKVFRSQTASKNPTSGDISSQIWPL